MLLLANVSTCWFRTRLRGRAREREMYTEHACTRQLIYVA